MKELLLIAVLLAPAGATAQISTGTVTGEVRTREGQPAVGVRVSAMAIPEAGVPANSMTALVSIGTTDRLRNQVDHLWYRGSPLKFLSGHPLVNEAVIQAVRQWTYKPLFVNGQTVPVITTVTVNFTSR